MPSHQSPPTGDHLEQADGTAWISLFCENMIEIGVELAAHARSFEDLSAKFVDHLLWIAYAMNRIGSDGLWDENGFYRALSRIQRLRVFETGRI